MTIDQIRERIPDVLDALRSMHLGAELEEVRDHLEIQVRIKSVLAEDAATLNRPSEPRFQPIKAKGEPASRIILRDRGSI